MDTGTALRQARDQAGLSRDRATQDLATRYPTLRITPKTLERIERNDPKANPKTVLIAALCSIYGRTINDVAPWLLEDSRALRDLLVSVSGWKQELVPAA